jgi:signal transduction histidine kinase
MGIGLNVVRSIVRAHGGTVVAYSDGRGQGARFRIRLPAMAREKVPA